MCDSYPNRTIYLTITCVMLSEHESRSHASDHQQCNYFERQKWRHIYRIHAIELCYRYLLDGGIEQWYYEIGTKLVFDCLKVLNALGHWNNVRLFLVPGHKGFRRNEKADELASLGSGNKFVGPKTFTGLSFRQVKTEIKEGNSTVMTRYWRELPGLTHSKQITQ